jgi:hypothetical protein
VAARTTFDLGANERIVPAGNSLTAGGIAGAGGTSTAWWTYLLGFLNLVRRTTTGCSCTPNGPPTFPAGNSLGFSGTLMSKFADPATTTAILAQSPTIVIPEWGVNDASAGTSPSTVASELGTGVTALWASNPAIKVVVLGVCNNGECWPSGNVSNPFDANIDAINTALAAECDTLSASGAITWLDIRNTTSGSLPSWMGQIQILNPANVQNGHHMTVDNLHDNVVGATFKSQWVAGRAVLV